MLVHIYFGAFDNRLDRCSSKSYFARFILAPNGLRRLHAVTQRQSCRSGGAYGEHRGSFHVYVRNGNDHLTVASKSITN